jgi:hypothetical protein
MLFEKTPSLMRYLIAAQRSGFLLIEPIKQSGGYFPIKMLLLN